ncbi:MAG: DNA recombination protein RmuC [Phycisphaerae bacterium]
MDVLSVVIGIATGAAAAYVLIGIVNRRERERLEVARTAGLDAVVEQLKTTFSALSREALSKNTEDFLNLAKTRLEQQTVIGSEKLESKKKLIDAHLAEMRAKLSELSDLTHKVDKDRRESAGAIKTELAKTTEATGKLRETTGQLREALANPQRRGAWGERMAEDVLRLAGFVEGVNYEKHARVASGEVPDFSFVLPKGLRLNMDVKFPLDNYLRAVEAEDDKVEDQFASSFLRDVRKHLKDVAGREYIDPGGGTVECVLVFIPNEQVYGYVHQRDRSLIDDAVKQRIVLCSPLTLYAVLAVIRQAVDNFRLEQVSMEILSLLGSFQHEWAKYCGVVEKLGRALEAASKQFEDLQGVRTRKLERQLDRIEDLRQAKGVALPDEEATLELEQPTITSPNDS